MFVAADQWTDTILSLLTFHARHVRELCKALSGIESLASGWYIFDLSVSTLFFSGDALPDAAKLLL